MENAIQLLGVWLPLYNMCHLLNVSEHEVRDIHHSYSSEMHQQSNVVVIQPGEPTFTSEVLDNDFHRWRKPVFQKLEGEYSLHFVFVSSLDVRIIVLPINILTFVPFFTHIWNTCSLWDDSWWYGECYSGKGYFIIVQMCHKQPCQLMMKFDSFYHFTKIKAWVVFKERNGKWTGLQLPQTSGFLSDNSSSFMRLPLLYVSLPGTVTKGVFFKLILTVSFHCFLLLWTLVVNDGKGEWNKDEYEEIF